MWRREVDHYPTGSRRATNLAIVIVTTMVLYYQLYVAGAVAPQLLADLDMSFKYFIVLTVISNLVGAFASLLAGLCDRFGRANIVVYGLLSTVVLILFAVPNATTKTEFAAATVGIGLIEGVILVATPALVRDFTPQVGRAAAMGLWSLGPIGGSIVVTALAQSTLPIYHTWQSQYVICGVIGLAVFFLAFFCLRELSGPLRSQIMVSMQDRALVEARAGGIDVQAAVAAPWKQMLRLNIVVPAFAFSTYMLLYFAAVSFFTLYLTIVHGFDAAEANGILLWFWLVQAAALILTGVVSDRLGVRKPIALLGGLGTVVTTAIFLTGTTDANAGYIWFVTVVSFLGLFHGIADASWMAAFTETVEQRNPALTATGLSVWGWTMRMVVAVSTLFLPYVITSVTPLVEAPKHLAMLEALKKSGTPPTAGLQEKLAEIQQAAAAAPGQWQTWWWICLAGQVIFLPSIMFLTGHWSVGRARAAREEHHREAERQLAASGNLSLPRS
ncbi:MFS transporter [Streptomyces sp. NPDC085932]|uniref:MFS transporter n=1 Tax=Streptomyces sp. NPDC085932 TaxID=3365741 RepID=UPI0037D5A46F